MNKLMGFLELKEMCLPVIPWKQYTGQEELDDEYLWTIRSAIYRGNDLNLPRLVGENAEKAKKFADQLFLKMKEKGIVIYYPYFIAKKKWHIRSETKSGYYRSSKRRFVEHGNVF